MKTVLAALAAVAGLTVAASAIAQDYRGPPEIILYEQPGFQGRSRTFHDDVGNLSDKDFNDHTRSLRTRGRWVVCSDAQMRGHCEKVRGDYPDLRAINMDHTISSIRYDGYREPPPPPPVPVAPPPAVYGRDALEGRSAGFFLTPSLDGADIPAEPYRADGFCRAHGYDGAAYFDNRAPVLRDLLCKR